MSDLSDTVIIGLGNKFRNDDGVGIHIAEILRALNIPRLKILTAPADGTAMISAWSGYKTAIIIDAVKSNGKVGTIHRFDALNQSIPEKMFESRTTHAFSVTETVALARALDRLPAQLIVFGIEGEKFDLGINMTEAVIRAADEVVERISGDIIAGREQWQR